MAANMLQLPFRQTHPVSFLAVIRQYISAEYEQHPDMFKEDLEVIDRLRDEAVSVQEPHISGVHKLMAYAAQLRWLGNKFPVDIGVDFTWYPALGFNAERAVVENNLRFELANVLYNLVALYSQLAFATNRNSGDGLKTASQHLSAAAGVLLFLKSEIIPDMRVSNPEDLDEATLECLEQLCLAQAQECFWQKAVKDQMRDATIARLAAKVSDYYWYACDWAIKSDAISTEWIHHMDAKHHHFAAAAQYRQSLDCLEKQKYGEEIARLRDSLSCVKEALKESKWVNKAVLGDMNGLRNKVVEDLKRAERDNDVIYLDPVPPKTELRMLDRANMVASTSLKELQDDSFLMGEGRSAGRPLFTKLIPYSVRVAAGIYADRRDRLVNQNIISELEAITARLRDLLASLELPGSLQALEKPLGIPSSLASKAEELRQEDALHRLRQSLGDTTKLKNMDKAMYNEAKKVLQAEKTADDSARIKYGTERWVRPPSEICGDKLWKQSSEIASYLDSAGSSDELVNRKVEETEPVLEVMTGSEAELESFVPNSRQTTLMPQVESAVSQLRACLNDIARLELRRQRKIDMLRDKAKDDDINAALLDETARLERDNPMGKIEPVHFEMLFDRRLQKYNADLEAVAGERQEQEALITHLQEVHAEFRRIRRGDSSTKERERVLQELENGYSRYKEILSNLDAGRKFYNDLANIVARFRDSCEAFAHQRRMEADRLEMDVSTSTMASVSLRDTTELFQRQKQHEASRPPEPPRSREDELVAAPRPTRAVVSPTSASAGMWTPDMGIKFGPPVQKSNNPHSAAYPQATSTMNLQWAESRPRFL